MRLERGGSELEKPGGLSRAAFDGKPWGTQRANHLVAKNDGVNSSSQVDALMA
jgi:hypothetical protein